MHDYERSRQLTCPSLCQPQGDVSLQIPPRPSPSTCRKSQCRNVADGWLCLWTQLVSSVLLFWKPAYTFGWYQALFSVLTHLKFKAVFREWHWGCAHLADMGRLLSSEWHSWTPSSKSPASCSVLLTRSCSERRTNSNRFECLLSFFLLLQL